MAIEIQEKFQVEAPVDAVWRFMMDPRQVVTCMPGAVLEEVVDDRTFLGSVRVKLGAITTSYKGRVQFTEVDDAEHMVRMLAEGRETGGGTAKGTLCSRIGSLPDGRTEVVAEASVDLTGRVVQMGRGMIQGVSHQLFAQFVASAVERLEGPQDGAEQKAVGAPAEGDAIRIAPLILQVVFSPILRFLRRLLGRPVA